jgi:predicted nucleotidyltransferase
MNLHGINLASEEVRDFCARWKIANLSVFGSILRDDFRPDSDIDFLAEFDSNAEWDAFDHLDMEEDLARLLGRRVEIVGRTAIEASGNRFYYREILGKAEQVCARG